MPSMRAIRDFVGVFRSVSITRVSFGKIGAHPAGSGSVRNGDNAGSATGSAGDDGWTAASSDAARITNGTRVCEHLQKPLRECLLVHTVFLGVLLPGGHSEPRWTGSRAVPAVPMICLVITGCATTLANVARSNGVRTFPKVIPIGPRILVGLKRVLAGARETERILAPERTCRFSCERLLKHDQAASDFFVSFSRGASRE
jgi:hypothetical protein